MKTIYHIILSDNTVTFLDLESAGAFIADSSKPNRYSSGREFVMTSSEITEYQYNKLLAMRDESIPEPQKDNKMADLYPKLPKPLSVKTNWDTDFNTEVPKPFTVEKLKAMTPEPMKLKGILHTIGGTFKPYCISFTYHDRRVNGYRYKCRAGEIKTSLVEKFNNSKSPDCMIGKRFVDKDRNVCEITYCNFYQSRGFYRATSFVVKAKFVNKL